ncbi:MAG: porin family protein [Alphaproteobacteria bacterium]|nr:porin family protein [Alphaproteobacteria bacterium]
MKRTSLIISCLLVFLPILSVNADNYTNFLSINMRYTYNNMNNKDTKNIEYKNLSISKDLLGMGLEFGTRFDITDIYHLGFSVNYNFFGNEKFSLTSNSDLKDMNVGYHGTGISFDNYIRLETTDNNTNRIDLIAGLGYEHIWSILDTNDTKNTNNSGGISLKLGLEHAFATNWAWNITGQTIFALKNQAGLLFQNMFSGTLGIKYKF